MHVKQKRIDSLRYVNDTVFLTHVYLSFLQPNKSFYLSKRRLFCLPSLLVTANQTSSLGELGSRVYRRNIRVYEQ